MRASGILMHISSLPSDYGIGTMGKEAYKFVDFLAEAKQVYWQILPICPTSYGDSPYQSFSTNAGNPYFIDLDMLEEEGLLDKDDYKNIKWGADKSKVDYANIYNKRFPVLRKAFERFKNSDLTEFNEFLAQNEMWISNYALFMSIKDENNGVSWLEWDDNLRKRDSHSLWLFKSAHEEDVMFWEFLQFKFFEQWRKLKAYANERGIKIIGDIPIYVALDSADVWVHPDLFELDEDLIPTAVAGCPPDAFSPTGQLWGNPLYNWSRHKETDYGWWLNRITASTELYDLVRIDHFRGFDGYYSIPYGDETAENGEWRVGPGIEFFKFAEDKLGKLPIIAEDLGFLTPSVLEMLEKSGFPGMKVLEFAFDPREESNYLPYNYVKNCVVYIGTHDNDTILGWANDMDKDTISFCKKFLDYDGEINEDFVWKFIKTAFASVGDTAIIQMQDYLMIGSDARMNIPSILGGNWQWRAGKRDFTKSLANKIADVTRTYGRCRR
jgi:4-alpha-glucanotransferase